MKIKMAKAAGFCFGVNRAVETVLQGIENGKKIVTLGPIIHNEQVIASLAEKGVTIIREPSQAKPGETVVIRSHGVKAEIEQYLLDHEIEYIDCTCPFVKKIQKIVKKHHDEGWQIVIIGDENHPEVMGINGWCGDSAFVIGAKEDVNKYNLDTKKICVVAQTTINRELWNFITEILKNTCQETLFFDTICSATNERQNEAALVAQNSDVCIVIGGKNSSNTCKLTSICKTVCAETIQIEEASQLPADVKTVWKDKRIGITAGASTPDWIIKEVLRTMNENMNMETAGEEASFAEAFEKSLVTLNTGDVVTGTVIAVTPTEVYVDLGFKADGVIPLNELTDDPALKPEDLAKVGDQIEVFIVRVNDVEGTVKLSKKKLDSIKGWKIMEEAFDNQTILKGKVIEVVNGGIIVLVEGIRVFVPASQANDRYLSDLSVLMGKEVSLRLLDMNQRKRKLVGSIKSVLLEEKAKKSEAFWSTVENGKTYVGTVKTLTPFGAFVDIGGVDGLVHISELSWNRIKHPSEVLKEGDTVEVYIIDANKETGKISLGYRKQEDNPWEIAKNNLHVGDVVKVKVAKLVPFGAFVEIMPGIDGLVHISQIANKRVAKPSDELEIGQEVDAKILDINWETKKIGLSIRALIEEEPAQEATDGPDVVEVDIEAAVAAQKEELDATEAANQAQDEAKEVESTEE